MPTIIEDYTKSLSSEKTAPNALPFHGKSLIFWYLERNTGHIGLGILSGPIRGQIS